MILVICSNYLIGPVKSLDMIIPSSSSYQFEAGMTLKERTSLCLLFQISSVYFNFAHTLKFVKKENNVTLNLCQGSIGVLFTLK